MDHVYLSFKSLFQERMQMGFQRILGNWLSQCKRWLGDSVLWRVSQKAWSVESKGIWKGKGFFPEWLRGLLLCSPELAKKNSAAFVLNYVEITSEMVNN